MSRPRPGVVATSPQESADDAAESDRGFDVPGRTWAAGTLGDSGHAEVRDTDARRGDQDDQKDPT
jgi:hypothetical protein